jgi:threonine dehydrogenase-like Zn-dependent dehydrogenase
MTAMPTFKIETTASDSARVGDRVVRVFGAVPCPHCRRGRLHASSLREIGGGEFAWTCPACHRDLITISAS